MGAHGGTQGDLIITTVGRKTSPILKSVMISEDLIALGDRISPR